MPDLLEALKRKAGDLDWSWDEDEGGYVQLSKCSPAGEDFFIVVNAGNMVDEIRNYSDSFDTERHVHDLMDAKDNGLGGVPGLKELVEDADAIQEMLEGLADAMEAVEEAGK